MKKRKPRARDPWKKLLSRVRSSATPQLNLGSGTQQKRRGHTVILTPEQLEVQFHKQRGRCYWLGIKLKPDDVFKSWSPLAPGVDRLDNARGYYPANIVIASRFANLGRQHTPTGKFGPSMRKLRRLIAADKRPEFLFDTPTQAEFLL